MGSGIKVNGLIRRLSIHVNNKNMSRKLGHHHRSLLNDLCVLLYRPILLTYIERNRFYFLIINYNIRYQLYRIFHYGIYYCISYNGEKESERESAIVRHLRLKSKFNAICVEANLKLKIFFFVKRLMKILHQRR